MIVYHSFQQQAKLKKAKAKKRREEKAANANKIIPSYNTFFTHNITHERSPIYFILQHISENISQSIHPHPLGITARNSNLALFHLNSPSLYCSLREPKLSSHLQPTKDHLDHSILTFMPFHQAKKPVSSSWYDSRKIVVKIRPKGLLKITATFVQRFNYRWGG